MVGNRGLVGGGRLEGGCFPPPCLADPAVLTRPKRGITNAGAVRTTARCNSRRTPVTISYADLQTPFSVATGVYAPQDDSRLLVDAMERAGVVIGRTVLDLCTGTGVVALAAARLGAAAVMAWDICPRAVRCARANARSSGLDVDVRLGALTEAMTQGPYDVVVSNPPYVPTPPDSEFEVTPPAAGPAWAWNAGANGRAVLDPLCLPHPICSPTAEQCSWSNLSSPVSHGPSGRCVRQV